MRDQFADLLCGLSSAEEVQDYSQGEVEGVLLPGDPAPQQGVTALLTSMDADDGIDEPFDKDQPAWELIAELSDEVAARAIYDEHCGPDAKCSQDVAERCSAAWNKRNGIDEKKEADSLFKV